MKSAVVDKRGRITVPLEIRQRLGLAAGGRVEFVIEDDRIVFRSATNEFTKWIGVFGEFPGGEDGILEWIRDMREE